MLRGRTEAGPYFIVILQQPPRPKNIFAYAVSKGISLPVALRDRELGINKDEPWSPPAVEDVVDEIMRINPFCKVLRGGCQYRKFDPFYNRDGVSFPRNSAMSAKRMPAAIGRTI